MSKKVRFFAVSLCNILTLSLILWPFPYIVKEIKAEEVSSIYMGQAIAIGNTFLTLSSGQQLKINSYPMPLFDKSRIETGDGAALISLVPEGLIEVYNDTDVLFHKKEGRNILGITKGVIRFSIPARNSLSIITPSTKLGVRSLSGLAIERVSFSSSSNSGKNTGVVRVEGDTTFISGTKGSFGITTVDGTTHVLRSGEIIRIAQAGVAGPFIEPLAGMTSSQLNVLAAQEGVTVITGVTTVPELAAGEVALAIPAELGGGFIVGTPATIATGMNAAGLTVTAAAISGTAVAAGPAAVITGITTTGTIVAGGVVAAGAAVAIAEAQNDNKASPSQ